VCAEHASAEHLANVLGALGLAVADEVEAAVVAAADAPSSVAAAMSVLGTWGAGSTVDALAQALGVTHSRAVRVADRLEADGLVRRERSPDDARAVLLRPTARGKRAATRLQEERRAALERWLAPLDAEERARLGVLADKLLAARARDALVAVHTCRLCDADGCGHPEGCPVTQGSRARTA
jgi:DNA-binding MarR family transcriptional regulator